MKQMLMYVTCMWVFLMFCYLFIPHYFS